MKSTGGMEMKKSIVFGIMAGILLVMGAGIACAGFHVRSAGQQKGMAAGKKD